MNTADHTNESPQFERIIYTCVCPVRCSLVTLCVAKCRLQQVAYYVVQLRPLIRKMPFFKTKKKCWKKKLKKMLEKESFIFFLFFYFFYFLVLPFPIYYTAISLRVFSVFFVLEVTFKE
jgi:hypothetical protein